MKDAKEQPLTSTQQATPPPSVDTYEPPIYPSAPSPRYIPKKAAIIILIIITVGGLLSVYFNFKYFQTNPQNSAVEINPTPTTQADAIAEWKTYTNEAFSFQYPPYLYAKASPRFPGTTFLLLHDIDLEQANEGPFAPFSITVWQENQFPEDYYKDTEKSLRNMKDETIVMDNRNARKISGEMIGYMEGTFTSNVHIVEDNKDITILFYEDTQSFSRDIFNQILSSFTFTK